MLGLRYPGGYESEQGIFALTVDAWGRVYVAGTFTNIAGVNRSGLIRLLSNGGVDETFLLTNGLSGPVFSLLWQPGGKLLVGGGFMNYWNVSGGGPNFVTRLNPEGNVDSSFVPPFPIGLGNGFSFYSMATVSNRESYLAGKIYNAIGRTVYRIQADGRLDSTFVGPAVRNPARAMLWDEMSTRLYVAGGSELFNFPEGQSQRIEVWINGSGEFGTLARAHGTVRSMALDARGGLLVGTTSTNINGVTRTYLGRLNPDGVLDTNFNVTLDGPVYSIVPRWADDSALITGAFTSVNGVQRGGVARIWGGPVSPPALTNLPTTSTVASGETVSFSVGPVRPRGDTVQWFHNGVPVAGATGLTFQIFNPLTTHSGGYSAVVSNLSGVTTSAVTTLTVEPPDLALASLDREFSAGGELGPDGPVYTMALQPNGRILIGGSFSNIAGLPRIGIARLDGRGTLDSTFEAAWLRNSDPVYYPVMIRKIVPLPDGSILVAGRFSIRTNNNQLGGFHGVAKLRANGELDPSYYVSTTTDVLALHLAPSNQVVFGGNSSIVWSPLSNPVQSRTSTSFGGGPVLDLRSMEDGRVVAVGGFEVVRAGVARRRIARFLPSGEIDAHFNLSAVPTGMCERSPFNPTGRF
ncbi:MAG: hypothetical protein IPK15_13525 [Verrucomicrobia bacterium]|nr:hypothetical protein [Verrucomicrobiota bacterium]